VLKKLFLFGIESITLDTNLKRPTLETREPRVRRTEIRYMSYIKKRTSEIDSTIEIILYLSIHPFEIDLTSQKNQIGIRFLPISVCCCSGSSAAAGPKIVLSLVSSTC
jgi:hypothetical protein